LIERVVPAHITPNQVFSVSLLLLLLPPLLLLLSFR
jgi:hypothetical protein